MQINSRLKLYGVLLSVLCGASQMQGVDKATVLAIDAGLEIVFAGAAVYMNQSEVIEGCKTALSCLKNLRYTHDVLAASTTGAVALPFLFIAARSLGKMAIENRVTSKFVKNWTPKSVYDFLYEVDDDSYICSKVCFSPGMRNASHFPSYEDQLKNKKQALAALLLQDLVYLYSLYKIWRTNKGNWMGSKGIAMVLSCLNCAYENGGLVGILLFSGKERSQKTRTSEH